MLIQRAYKTELDLTQAQTILAYRSAGTARFAYNWGLAKRKAHREAWEALPEEQRGTYKGLSLYELKKEWNRVKPVEFPWASEVSTYCMQSAMADLEKAFQNFFRRVKQGGKPGFPRFKSKKKGIGGFRLYGCIHAQSGHIQLPTFGLVKLKEKGYLPTEGVKILAASISERAGRWYVSLQVEMEIPEAEAAPGTVGVDLGIKHLATLSDGTQIPNPRALPRAQRKLKRLQRAVSRKKKGSANRKKAIRRLAKAHARVANIRTNAIHQATHAITKRYGTVVVEDLNVRGMVRNHALAGSISDAGFREFRRQLEYKAGWRGGRVIVADRFSPSSKTCSHCGVRREELKLAERVFHCPDCGHVQDRDLNAARNLLSLAGKAPERLNACGEERCSLRAVLLSEAGTCADVETCV